MISYEQICTAVFDNDSRADEGISALEIISSCGFDPQAVIKASEQRALRMVLLERGPATAERMKDQAYAKKFSVEQLDAREQDKLNIYSALWMDAFVACAKTMITFG